MSTSTERSVANPTTIRRPHGDPCGREDFNQELGRVWVSADKPRLYRNPACNQWACGAYSGSNEWYYTHGRTPLEAQLKWRFGLAQLTRTGMRWEIFP